MIIRNITCIHCGAPIEGKRASKKYCSDRCRVFQFRETSDKPTANKKRRSNLIVVVDALDPKTEETKSRELPQTKSHTEKQTPIPIEIIRKISDVCPHKNGINRTIWIEDMKNQWIENQKEAEIVLDNLKK